MTAGGDQAAGHHPPPSHLLGPFYSSGSPNHPFLSIISANPGQPPWSLLGRSAAAPLLVFPRQPSCSLPPTSSQHPEGPDYKPDGVAPVGTTLKDFLPQEQNLDSSFQP